MKSLKYLVVFALVAACASTSVTPLSKNRIMISTSAAPACGLSGAKEVAGKMAAVETIRRGYERYIILGADAESNVTSHQSGPTYAMTTGTYRGYGNTLYGNSTTQFGGSYTVYSGSNDAALEVLLLNKGEPNYGDGIDAKSTLGEKWQELVEKGVTTCS